MYQKILFSILFSFFIYASETPIFDQYHNSLCEALLSTSNKIDNYFIDGNKTEKSQTYAELITSIAYETKELGFENDIRIRLRLDLPKIEKNLRLVFEDESSDNLLYDGTSLDNQKLQDKEYYLRLEYFNYIREQFNLRLGGGIKIRESNLVPYLTTRLKYYIVKNDKTKIEFFNRFRYYTDSEIENSFEFNSILNIKPDTYLINHNNYFYSNENPFQVLANDITILHLLNEKKHLSYGVGISTNIDELQSSFVEYYHLHATWHHLFYKNLVYYELVPSILQRGVNNFQTSYRLLVNFGIYFNKYK
jgi:hypothetical protein